MHQKNTVNQHVTLASLHPHPRNYNRHPPTQIERIAASLHKFGQVRSIVVWRSTILAGHGVVEAARALGWTELNADVLPDDYPEHLALAYVAADNELGRLGDPDQAALAAILEESRNADADLLEAIGYSDAEFESLLAEVGAAEKPTTADTAPQIDRAEELRQKWGVNVGDLWQLGEHRLICGDARTAGLVGDFAIFDPPWDWSASQYDEAMGWVRWKKACCMGLSEMFPLSSRADYRCFWVWDQLTGVNISNQSPFLPMRSCVVMFDFGDLRRFYATEALRVLHKIGVCENHRQSAPQYVPIVRRYQDGKEAMHSGVKPAALSDYVVTLYSKPGEIVVDPFAGSGSFLLSSHRLGRQWQGSEIDPANCAVILERFCDATGVTPQRIDAALPAEAV